MDSCPHVITAVRVRKTSYFGHTMNHREYKQTTVDNREKNQRKMSYRKKNCA